MIAKSRREIKQRLVMRADVIGLHSSIQTTINVHFRERTSVGARLLEVDRYDPAR